MPTSTTPVGPTPVASALGAAPAASPSSRPDTLGKDAFLKLLVAQLRYQDPTNPTDSSQFMSQTAQFTQVEKLEEIARSTTEMLGAQSMLATSALVGRTVTYAGTDGADVTGVVASASFGPGGPRLQLADGTDLAVTDVTQVRAAGTQTAPGS
jgi:flagellar basal-body rod modification protein FlgD